ncbi:MAG: hypothetical protein IT389_10920 [Nitrospira sp.]|nr:hypothetical protein [Nitrospira sp.]
MSTRQGCFSKDYAFSRAVRICLNIEGNRKGFSRWDQSAVKLADKGF